MISHSKIIISDEKTLNSKKDIFKNSFIKHEDDDGKKDKIIVVTDFDYTLYNKYNYYTGEKYESSFQMYNQDAFGGNQKDFNEKRIKLYDIYVKFEEDFSLEEKVREAKLREWCIKEMSYMIHPKFSRDSIREMVKFKKIDFKKNVSKFFEKLIELNIPIIIVSAGIKEIILEILRLINIKGLDNYIERKRILFIANEFIFNSDNKCIDFNKDVIHGFNKSDQVKKLVEKNFPNIENVFVLGDLDTDYKSIEKLNLDKNKNIIGIGYINYTPDELKNKDFDIYDNEKINKYKKIFDINLLMDEGYDYPLELLNILHK